jgi:uncharacterized protein (TIRG00374 family)
MPIDPKSPKSLLKLRWIYISTALGVLVYVAVLAWGDQQNIMPIISQINGATISLVLGCSLLNYGLRFLRWKKYIAHFGCVVPAWRHFLYYMAGFALTISPAKAGEALRALYLRPYGVTYTKSLAAMIAERVLDLLVVVGLGLLMVLALPQQRWILVAGVFIVGILIWIVADPRVLRWLDAISARLASPLLMRAIHAAQSLLNSARQLFSPSLLRMGLILGTTAWLAEGYGLWLITNAMNLEITMTFAVGAYGISLIAGALSFLPGGLGGAEAALVAMLLLAGVSLSDAITATALCRLATLWFAVILGLTAILITGKPKPLTRVMV